jgi:nucleotide-binding universal stress UspA family protein
VIEQLYAGSDITELLHRTARPVLVYKYLSESSFALETPFERPLLATDWSPASLKAVDYLKELTEVIKEIHVVHVAGPKQLSGSAMTIQKTRKKLRRQLDEICATFAAEGIRRISHLYVGSPEQEIEKAARENQATLIVMGSSGKAAGWNDGSAARRGTSPRIQRTRPCSSRRKNYNGTIFCAMPRL